MEQVLVDAEKAITDFMTARGITSQKWKCPIARTGHFQEG